MLAFPGMLVKHAQAAGIKTPPDPEHYSKEEYPHFFVFEACQLGAAMPYPSCAFDNAVLIAAIPDDQILNVTYRGLLDKGFADGYPNGLA
jgi:hypothetical protein